MENSNSASERHSSSVQSILPCQLLPKNVKPKMYNVVNVSVVLYGHETGESDTVFGNRKCDFQLVCLE
jgi:hypothetical protein